METLSLTIGMEKEGNVGKNKEKMKNRRRRKESSHPPVLHLNEGEARVERFTLKKRIAGSL